jgi:aryl-alcohol dehydrogenase-like predicted oxidoreductase
MKDRVLGRSGIQVSQLCLGTMAFGGDADAAEAGRMFRAARDAGINFFDTADQYNNGRSEEVLGELMRGSRDDLVIATKCFNPTGSDVNARGASRRHVRRALEASLKRLGTDRVEVLYLHHYDVHTPLEEHARALEDVVRSGKALYGAVSNYAAWQTQAMLGYQERNGWAPLHAIQPMYSLVKRQAEVELLPMAKANGIGVVPYGPTAGGLLSGRYLQAGATGRHTVNPTYKKRYAEDWLHETTAKFVAYCKQRGWHPVSAAVAWAGAHPAVTAPIVGARNAEQLKASLESVKITLSTEQYAQIAALSRTPPPPTDRLEENVRLV